MNRCKRCGRPDDAAIHCITSQPGFHDFEPTAEEPAPESRKHYLGDAVYYEKVAYGIVLTTENGVAETNRIELEPEVIVALLRSLGGDYDRAKLREAIGVDDERVSEGIPEPVYIQDGVALSNKDCPRYYSSRVGGEMVPRKRCTCPEGRCWYDEQQERRRQGKLALNPAYWPEKAD